MPALAQAGDLSTYASARLADADGRSDIAIAGYARALADAPANPRIALRAYRAAIVVGDDALARRAGAVLDRAKAAPADVALLDFARAARANDHPAAALAITRLSAGQLHILAPALSAWLALSRGGDAFAPLAVPSADPVARRFAAETHALLLIATGREADGLAEARGLAGASGAVDLRLAAAQLLFGRGRDADARSLLQGDDPVLAATRAGSPARPSLAFGASWLFARVAADLATGNPTPLSIALTRAALIAEPGDDRARLLLADALSRGGASDRALGILGDVKPSSPFAVAAAAARVSVLSAAGGDGEAIAAAAAQAGRPDAGAGDWQRYGDLLVGAGRFGEGADWYRRVIDAGPPGDGWAAWLQYGGALDRAGDWPKAEAALAKAVALGPDQPVALNYLGYARVERGEDVGGATRLLERAVRLAPDDASIRDSLGWAYHLGGDTARGLPLIEAAARAQPGNAEIGEHLGDAYWTLGRRYEARYAWRAAAVGAEAGDAARLAAKVRSGLVAKP